MWTDFVILDRKLRHVLWKFDVLNYNVEQKSIASFRVITAVTTLSLHNDTFKGDDRTVTFLNPCTADMKTNLKAITD